MRPRWITPTELGDYLADNSSRVARLTPKRRREYAVRVVQRIEKRDGSSLMKKPGGRISISGQIMDRLRVSDGSPVASTEVIEASVAGLLQKTKELEAKLKAQAVELRRLDRRVTDAEGVMAALREALG